MKTINWLLPMFFTLSGCGVYTFNGSTLPSHLKTVDIPLFANQSTTPGVAEELTSELSNRIVSMNLLRVSSNRGDATIRGRVTDYTATPRSFGTSGVRQVTVSEYVVKISVEVEFLDNKSNSPLYKGTVTGEGVYNNQSLTEANGRKTAEKDVVDQILQKSLQSW
jgi:hypothetical protein